MNLSVTSVYLTPSYTTINGGYFFLLILLSPSTYPNYFEADYSHYLICKYFSLLNLKENSL